MAVAELGHLKMIRKDLFAVKADERDDAGWCFKFMCRSRQLANAKAKSIQNDHSLGLNRLAKVVHPAQWVVEAFIACGNKISD